MLDRTPTPPPSQSRPSQPRISHESSGAPPPSLLGPPSKKRRVTISGGPHPLNTDVRAPSLDPSNSTPISPAVLGFTIGRDDPAAIEQVRSMLTVKQKQKALIEQRRGSVAGIMNVSPNPLSNEQRRGSVAGILTVASNGNSPRPAGATRLSLGATLSAEERTILPQPPSRGSRRSPNSSAAPRASHRLANAASAPSQNVTVSPPSPSRMIVPSQSVQMTPNPEGNNLPPPPISFARRRAGQFGQGKNKPADIVISPRDAQTPDEIAPSIQSAPPVPHAQAAGRYPMSLPRLPPAMGEGGSAPRLISGKVPPTPTRLTMQRGPGGPRSPIGPSVPIATTLVPPTPTSLHRPGYVGEKSAFLAPFEMFYDSLNDSKQMKNWLAEQLQKSNALMQSLKHQQENLEEMVERAVEKKVGKMKEEITGLHRKVDDLESALRAAKADDYHRRPSIDTFGSHGKTRHTARNGTAHAPEPPASYTFPPTDRRSSPGPGWGRGPDREERRLERPSPPPPFSADRRLSVSSSRYEPSRPQPTESSEPRGSSRPSQGGFAAPTTVTKSSGATSGSKHPRQPHHERPGINRNVSLDAVGKAPGEETSSRRDVIMSPPDDIRRPSVDDT